MKTIGMLITLVLISAGSARAANVAFDDHPSEKRFAGQIETITVESVFAFAERAGLGRRIAPVTP